MKESDISLTEPLGASPSSQTRYAYALRMAPVFFIPNILLLLGIIPQNYGATTEKRWDVLLGELTRLDPAFYAYWIAGNLTLLGMVSFLRANLIRPLQRIAHLLRLVRAAYHVESSATGGSLLSLQSVAGEITRFSHFALEYYRKHKEVSYELEQARAIIAQFAQQQETLIKSTGREIGDQYRNVLAYANHLETQILGQKADPSLRYDFDDVCESSFNLKLIAGALAMLSSPATPNEKIVPLASLMQQTMLALAPSLDRRTMRLTTAEVDVSVAAQGDPNFIAHILWMMLLGLIRYAADESTLRIRCLHNREHTLALVSIVVSELTPLHFTESERSDHLLRQLQHLTPHMFAETIRIHGNLQLAELLLKRMGGSISILPLTVTACEICLTLPAAIVPTTV